MDQHPIPGTEVAALEAEFAAQLGAAHLGAAACVAVSSRSNAVHLALLAAGVCPGDEVVVPAYASARTAEAVTATGAVPVFADIDPETFCLDAQAAEAAVGPRTAAILPVHQFGHPADLTAFAALAQRRGIALVEDASHAHGATWRGRAVGTFGAVGVFGLGRQGGPAATDGGIVVCADGRTADRVRDLRGVGLRMSDVRATVVRDQLPRLTVLTRVRRMNAALYTLGLRGVQTPVVPDDADHVFDQYVVRSTARARLCQSLARAGIEVSTPYATAVHRLPAHAQEVELPHTDRAVAEALALPVHPGVAGTDVRTVVRAVNRAVASRAA